MKNNYNSLDLIETRFISPENQEFIGELIKHTFLLLMKLAENISTLSKEDNENAISLVKGMGNDLSKTCRIFENFKIWPSGYTNTIWTYNLIVNLFLLILISMWMKTRRRRKGKRGLEIGIQV